jgi:hypothetical protein
MHHRFKIAIQIDTLTVVAKPKKVVIERGHREHPALDVLEPAPHLGVFGLQTIAPKHRSAQLEIVADAMLLVA